jgi:regulator of cell morphogenesis and NO signaling
MHNYHATDKMAELISQEYRLLQVMSRFGIPLGVGEKSVDEVCKEHGVDTETFLAVLNFVGNDCNHRFIANPEALSLPSLMRYLKEAHTYFLQFNFPSIRRKLIDAIGSGGAGKTAFLILQYFDNYVDEVRDHFQYEDNTVFPYVESLLAHTATGGYNIDTFATTHESASDKLTELKNIIIRYCEVPDTNYALHLVLFDIFCSEEELKSHGLVEEHLFVPAVKLAEKNIADIPSDTSENTEATDNSSLLSTREKEIVVEVVKGLTNKEIADKLCISLNTVLTHRRNIARKLEIHSPAGLTIYAIVNGLVELKNLDM